MSHSAGEMQVLGCHTNPVLDDVLEGKRIARMGYSFRLKHVNVDDYLQADL